MNKAKRRYQILLHRYLTSREMSQDMFMLLTQMTEEEINLWFTTDVRYVRYTMETLGKIVEYQKIKRIPSIAKICSLRQELGQVLSLWSDILGLESSPQAMSLVEYGLMVLKAQDHRQAAVWALRLNVVFPQESLSMRSPYRLRNLLSVVSNRCMSDLQS